ncbi:zinc ribbon domain-containing protein [candidate division KSB1 bacterium]|nr:MAG: zinc ribbon domain-containing protein [candidate division KSB1 bacterium]
MPTYEYQCENGHTFEEFQSIVAAPLDCCPICGGHAHRLISGGTGLIFKGSGFYLTDYGRSGGGGSSAAKNKAEKAEKSLADSASAPAAPAPAPKTETPAPATKADKKEKP